MGLAVVRSIDAPRRLTCPQDEEDFEQELVDQFLLAAVGAGIGDDQVSADRAIIFEFIRFLSRPVWTTKPALRQRMAGQRQDVALVAGHQKLEEPGQAPRLHLHRVTRPCQLSALMGQEPVDIGLRRRST
jgi:hypothetical protein